MTATSAINVIRAIRRGPTVSFSTSQRVSTAHTVEVSRSTAASPTVSLKTGQTAP